MMLACVGFLVDVQPVGAYGVDACYKCADNACATIDAPTQSWHGRWQGQGSLLRCRFGGVNAPVSWCIDRVGAGEQAAVGKGWVCVGGGHGASIVPIVLCVTGTPVSGGDQRAVYTSGADHVNPTCVGGGDKRRRRRPAKGSQRSEAWERVKDARPANAAVPGEQLWRWRRR